jgi:metallo-beta-lactamase class B
MRRGQRTKRATLAEAAAPANRHGPARAAAGERVRIDAPIQEPSMKTTPFRCALWAALAAAPAAAADMPAAWTRPVEPFRIAGNTWYLGSEGITVLLIRSDAGAVIIDAGVPGTLPALQRSLGKLGVAAQEIKLILTSHAHYDHVGALAALQEWTGARVLASADSAALLAAGGRGDLHFGDALPFAPVRVYDTLVDGEQVRLGALSLQLHLTPGHTPGSSTWTWTENSGAGTIAMVYADSLTAPGYRLLDHPQLPDLVATYRASFSRLRTLPCDLLLTPHPDASGLFERTGAGRRGGVAPVIDCAGYADRAERTLDEQIQTQRRAASAPAAGARD